VVRDRRDKPYLATPHAVPPPEGMTEWEDTLRVAQLAARDDFLAIRGFEYSSNVQGHVTVWFSREYVDSLTLGPDDLTPFWRWLATAQPDVAEPLGGLAHPGVQEKRFDNLAYRPDVNQRVVTMEIFNRGDDYFPHYLEALDNGWYLGAIGVSDHHQTDWGAPHLSVAGVYAEALTAEGLHEALLARRVYATRERGLHLGVCLDDAQMGERIVAPPGAELRLAVEVESSARGSGLAALEVYTSGGTLLAEADLSGRKTRWSFGLRAPQSGSQWYVVRILSPDRHIATASAIWVQAG
jgi:hypothetical protein